MTRWRLRSPLYRPPAPPKRARPPVEVPGTGITDLEQFIVAQLTALHPALRRRAQWVTDPWWLGYVRRLTWVPGSAGLGAALTLLGVPVEVAGDGGWPHLEPRDRGSRR